MMKYLLMFVFMIPICYSWWLYIYILMFLCFMFIFNTLSSYYLMLGYSLGFDVLSYWMIMLSFWILFLMIIASYIYSTNLNTEFLFLLIILLIFLVLSFSCSNLFKFYLFFESSMIPTLF